MTTILDGPVKPALEQAVAVATEVLDTWEAGVLERAEANGLRRALEQLTAHFDGTYRPLGTDEVLATLADRGAECARLDGYEHRGWRLLGALLRVATV